MKEAKITKWLIFLACVLMLAGDTLAMSSTNYRLDWFVPLTGGGGQMASSNYSIDLTVGQSVNGSLSNTSYRIGLGFWYGTLGNWMIYLPVILKN